MPKGHVVEGMLAGEYHAHPSIGSTMLKTFMKDRRLFEGKYVTGVIEDKPSKSQKLGTLLHSVVFEPDEFFRRLAPIRPEFHKDIENVTAKGAQTDSKVTKYVKEKNAEWEQQYQGMLQLTAEERDQLLGMAESINGNAYAKAILQRDGQGELSMFWTDEQTGLECKARWDWFSDVGADLKTTVDPTPGAFARQAGNFGYHLQAAHYLAGAKACHENLEPQLLHIAVGNKPPYTCAVYDMSDHFEKAEEQRRAALQALSEAIESGEFKNGWEKQVVKLALPPWSISTRYEIED